jgi:hypothetical protein
MGAGRLQKGALGQQLAASGQARRAESIRRKGKGEGPVGKGRARAVIEDRMDQNDKEGKQKQGKPGRPGKPIDGRPPVSRPIEGGDQPFPGKPPWMDEKPFPPKEGRPFEPPKEGRPKEPPWMDGKPLPPKEGRPIGDDQFPPRGGRKPPWMDGKPFPPRDGDVRIQPFPYPGRPPFGGRPPKGGPWEGGINLPDGRPPSKRPIRGKDQFGPGDIPDRPPFGGKKGPRRGGTEFGPGRGSRIPEGQAGLFGGVGGASGLQDFLARMAQLRGGGMK